MSCPFAKCFALRAKHPSYLEHRIPTACRSAVEEAVVVIVVDAEVSEETEEGAVAAEEASNQVTDRLRR